MKKENCFWALNLLVIFCSVVPLLVININLPSFEIVFLRTLFALLFIGSLLLYKKEAFTISRKDFFNFLISGIFTSVFWITMIYCAKMSNASVTLIGLATTPLWVSLITPIISKERLSFYRILIGLSALFGIYMIFNSGFKHHVGLLVAILCGLMSAMLNVFNSKLTLKDKNLQLAFYQSLGACVGTAFFAIISGNMHNLIQVPSLHDLGIIFLLALLFSVVSYLMLLQIFKFISVFTVSLVFNLSPIYGTLIALVVSGHSEFMNIYFYGGSTIIICSVFVHPLAVYLLTEPTIGIKEPDVTLEKI